MAFYNQNDNTGMIFRFNFLLKNSGLLQYSKNIGLFFPQSYDLNYKSPIFIQTILKLSLTCVYGIICFLWLIYSIFDIVKIIVDLLSK